MDAFETRLRQRARTEPFSLPEQFVQQVQATCDALPEKAENHTGVRCSFRWLQCWPFCW